MGKLYIFEMVILFGNNVSSQKVDNVFIRLQTLCKSVSNRVWRKIRLIDTYTELFKGAECLRNSRSLLCQRRWIFTPFAGEQLRH